MHTMYVYYDLRAVPSLANVLECWHVTTTVASICEYHQ